MTGFDLVVSLGGWCQTGLQIRRRTGQLPAFFDPLGTPFWGAKCLLEEKARDLADNIVCVNAGTDLACVRYGIVFHHEVERDAEGRVLLTAGSMTALASGLHLRWRRLMMKVERARGVLFIRQGGYMRGPNREHIHAFDREPFGSGELWRMTQAIDSCWPNLNYHLAFVYYPEHGVWDFREPVERASAHAFDFRAAQCSLPPDLLWRGYEPDWDALFDHYGVQQFTQQTGEHTA